jgi:hypothetical protein
VRIEDETVKIRKLQHVLKTVFTFLENGNTHIFEMFHQLWVFVCNVFLNKRRSPEKFLACLAPKLALIFLLDMRFGCFGKLPVMVQSAMIKEYEKSNHPLLIRFATIFARINTVPVNEQRNLGV